MPSSLGRGRANGARRRAGVTAALVTAVVVVGTGATGASASAPAAPGGPAAIVFRAGPSLKAVTACQVFTSADAKALIGPAAHEDRAASRTVNFNGQRNSYCVYAAGKAGLVNVQLLAPLNTPGAQALKQAFASNEVSFQGKRVTGIGSAAFWKDKVGTPALYVLTKDDVLFNIGSTTTGTNSASEAQLKRVAIKMVKAL